MNHTSEGELTTSTSSPSGESKMILVSKTVYSVCYYVSYGVVFPSLWVASLIPTDNAMGHGLSDGATAAREKVDAVRSKWISEGSTEKAGTPEPATA